MDLTVLWIGFCLTVCKGLTVLVYFYSQCRYITTVAPLVHLYDTKRDVWMNGVRLDTLQDDRYRMRI